MRRWSLIVLVVAAATAASMAQPAPGEAAEGRPNVLLVQVDDMRADDLVHLPKVRSWMSAGTKYVNAYVPTPNCCPSRATLMSGRYVHNNGQADQERRAFWRGRATIQGWLQEAGYRTGVAGKFLNWWPSANKAPGWDAWNVFVPGYDVRGQYSTHYVFDAAHRNIDAWVGQSRPWYLYLNPYAPHMPAIPEGKYRSSAVALRPRTPAHDEVDRSDKPAFIRSHDVTYDETTALHQNRVRSVRTRFWCRAVVSS